MEVPQGLVQGGLCHVRHIVQEAVRGAVPQGRRRPCWGGRSRAGLLEVHVGEGLAEKVRRSTCPRFLECYSNTNRDCIERYGRGEVKRRFSKQPRRVGTLRGDPRPAARCRRGDVFRSNDDEYKQARLLSKSHHHYSPRAAKLPQVRRTKGFPTAAGCVTSPW